MQASSAFISDSELAEIKEAVLNSIFNGRHLPGSSAPVTFPDLPFVFTQPQVYLVDEGAVNPVYIERINKPLAIISAATLKAMANETGKLIYLQFSPAKKERDNIQLSLESKVLSGGRSVPLSSLQLTFQKVSKQWQLLDTPVSLSS